MTASRCREEYKLMTDKPIGEIIEAGTTAFVAQCLEVPREIVPRLYDPPPFGSFVKIGKPAPVMPKLLRPPACRRGRKTTRSRCR